MVKTLLSKAEMARAAAYHAADSLRTLLAAKQSVRLLAATGASQFEFLRYLRDHPQSRVADVATTFAAGIGAISNPASRSRARLAEGKQAARSESAASFAKSGTSEATDLSSSDCVSATFMRQPAPPYNDSTPG